MTQDESIIQDREIVTSAGSTRSSLTRRAFVQASVFGLSGIALASCTHGLMDRNDIEITYRTFEIPNLPKAFDGKTVSFLSDIHSSPFMGLDELQHVVRLVNSLNSDIIVMPGDFVTSHHNEIGPFVEAMAELRAPLGVYACTGNHDYYAGVDLVSKAIEDIQVKLLRNENAKITIGNESLYFIGVDDEDAKEITNYVEGRPAGHIEAAYRAIPENAASIMLCHKPYHFEDFAKTNVGLMLSGHTHGGQIVFGRIGRTVLAFSSIASEYVDGLYLPRESKSKTQMYVSRGIGVVGVPIRINCPPEITKITLVAKAPAISKA